MSREEQSKYYDLARVERQTHMRLHPGWTARDNYAKHKKKKRKMQRENGATESRVINNNGGSTNGNKKGLTHCVDQFGHFSLFLSHFLCILLFVHKSVV